MAKLASFRSVVTRLSNLFAVPILEIEGAIVMSLEEGVERHLSSFPGDLAGFEAFVNHVHLDDLLASDAGKLRRGDLLTVGLCIIQVWSERLKPVLEQREILFYLGGRRGVTLRFHIARKGAADWINLSDTAFLRREKTRVFRLSDAGLVEEDCK